MKFTYMTAMLVIGALTVRGQQPKYVIVPLGTPGGTTSAANAINDRGWAMGAANLPGNTTEHATLWVDGKTIVDPLGKIWSCMEGLFPSSSGHTCQGFAWKDNVIRALPALGGNGPKQDQIQPLPLPGDPSDEIAGGASDSTVDSR
jgi:hypothetical protein